MLLQNTGSSSSASCSRRAPWQQQGAATRPGRHVACRFSLPSFGKRTPELRVCQGKTCKRQGSAQVLKFLQDLHIESDVTTKECGCLGSCGKGPNMVLLPQERFLAHVATPADAAQVLNTFCGIEVPQSLVTATQLRLAGNAAAVDGQLEDANKLYTQAIDLQPPKGLHLLYSNRAAARLQLGLKEAALEDAQKAVQMGPQGFTNGYVRLIDCLYALGRLDEAVSALAAAEAECAEFKGSREHKAIVQALQRAPAQKQGRVKARAG